MSVIEGRRDFLRALVLAGVSAWITAPELEAASRKKARPRFTQELRELNRRLKIDRLRWKMIVAHHSAIRTGNAAIYDRAHRRRGMENGLAYHFVIGNGVDSGEGEIEVGRRWLEQLQGGHVRNEQVNQIGIGVCLIGNFDQLRPTPKQLAAFTELVDYLRDEVLGHRTKFKMHREVDVGRTVCPGRYFPIRQMHRRYG